MQKLKLNYLKPYTLKHVHIWLFVPVGEPNEALTGEDCMEMVTSWGYQWNDKRCDHEQQYICKKPGIR